MVKQSTYNHIHRKCAINGGCTYLAYKLQYLNTRMQITIPKVRSEVKWKQNQSNIKIYEMKNDSIKFKDYCELSFLFIEADNEVFKGNKAEKDRFFKGNKYQAQLQVLLKPKIAYYTYSKRQQGKNDEAKKEELMAERIGKALGYAWKSIVDLINGKNNSSLDTGIYNDENINLNFARLESMLVQLKDNKYRCSIYTKDNAYVREMMEKEIEEEVVFIKLLQNILMTQTKRIQDNRKNYKDEPEPPEEQAEEEEVQEEEEKLPDIREVVKINEYFQRKLASMKEVANTSKDPIDRLEENRKFNAAAIRYHFHHSHARR